MFWVFVLFCLLCSFVVVYFVSCVFIINGVLGVCSSSLCLLWVNLAVWCVCGGWGDSPVLGGAGPFSSAASPSSVKEDGHADVHIISCALPVRPGNVDMVCWSSALPFTHLPMRGLIEGCACPETHCDCLFGW